MLSVEAVRAAVLSELPWEKLDGLVRAEMAAGRRVKDIAADFAALSKTVWDTPGLPEDGQDAFGDTYDALVGNCHRDCCYYDPPEPPYSNGTGRPVAVRPPESDSPSPG